MMAYNMIRELCYELYKVDWKHRHVTADMEMDTIKNYYEYLIDGDTFCTYEDYVSEFGHGGAIYAWDYEFYRTEYRYKDYMCSLLDNDRLIQMYLEDIGEVDN